MIIILKIILALFVILGGFVIKTLYKDFKLTENSDPNEACIEVIETYNYKTPELERLYNKIKNF